MTSSEHVPLRIACMEDGSGDVDAELIAGPEAQGSIRWRQTHAAKLMVAVVLGVIAVVCLSTALMPRPRSEGRDATVDSIVGLSVWDMAKGVVGGVGNAVSNQGHTIVNGASNAANTVADTGSHLVHGEVVEAAKSAASGSANTVKSFGHDTLHTYKNAASDAGQVAWDSCTTLTETVAGKALSAAVVNKVGTKAACASFLGVEEAAVASAAAAEAGVNPVMDAMAGLLPTAGVWACSQAVSSAVSKVGSLTASEFSPEFCGYLKGKR